MKKIVTISIIIFLSFNFASANNIEGTFGNFVFSGSLDPGYHRVDKTENILVLVGHKSYNEISDNDTINEIIGRDDFNVIVQTPNIEYLIGFNETDKYLVDIKIDGEYLYGIMRNGTKIWLKGIDIKSGEIALDLTFLIDVDEIYSTLMLEIDMGHYYILGATFNSVVF